MHIRDQRLTVQLDEDTAMITIAFTVIVLEKDMELGGGFVETVALSSPLIPVPQKGGPLPLGAAVQPSPIATYRELYREHTFRVPRYPAGRFTAVRFHGYIDIWPAVRMHDEKSTNEGVLPARYPLLSAVTAPARLVVRRLRDLIRG